MPLELLKKLNAKLLKEIVKDTYPNAAKVDRHCATLTINPDTNEPVKIADKYATIKKEKTNEIQK